MQDAAQFLEDSLREYGIDATVNVEESPHDLTRQFYITKKIGDEKLSYKMSITERELTIGSQSPEKLIAMRAEDIAREFKNKMTTVIEWGKKRVVFSPYDGGWAECPYCGEKVSAPKAEYLVQNSYELSDPYPTYKDMDKEWSRMNGNSKVLFKMYLTGLLRESCATNCVNSKYYRRP